LATPTRPINWSPNEAIVFYLSERGDSVSLAAADCCDIIAAKFSREVDTKNGALSVSASQRAAAYRKLGEDLRAQGAEFCEVFFGGQSIDGKIEPRDRHRRDSASLRSRH